MLFPFLTILLLVVYGCGSYYSTQRYIQKHANYSSSWATVTAHAIIVFSFHSVCHDTGHSCFGLSKHSTRLLHCKFQCTSISLHRTNLILGWNCFNNNSNSHDNGNDHGVLCLKTRIFMSKHTAWTNGICVSTSHFGWGSSPNLPCFACPLLVAAITDAFYATGIGIYYGIFY